MEWSIERTNTQSSFVQFLVMYSEPSLTKPPLTLIRMVQIDFGDV